VAKSPDHPELQFVEAAGFTHGRPDGPPLWLVIHTMEAQESSTTAENTANYFANPGDGRNVSAHYCCDNNSIVQCVLLKDSAWTVGNAPGNNRGINYELAGFASQTGAQWGDSFSTSMLQRVAPLMRSDAAKFGIPLKRCSVDDLVHFRKGVTSHNDLRLAFGVTSHTDPGPNFPWTWFIDLLNNKPEGDVSNVYKTPTDYWVSNGIHRRGPIRTKSPFFAQATAGMTSVELTEADRLDGGYDTWDAYLNAVAGPLFAALVCTCNCNCEGAATEHTHDMSPITGPVSPATPA